MIDTRGVGSITDTRNGETWDYDRLQAGIVRRADVLRDLAITAGSRIIISQGASPAFFADLFAAWQSGVCVACANPGLSREELANVIDFIDARAVLVDNGNASTDMTVPVIRAGSEQPRARQPAAPSAAVTLDDPALVLFTSGTTGTPKGVVHTFRSMLARTALNRLYIGEETLRHTLCVLPVHFGHGLIGNCLTPLLAGHSLYLAPGMDLANIARLGALVDEHRITFMSSVPALWRLLRKTGSPPAAGTLRQVNVGSAPLSAQLWQDIIQWSGTRNVVNMYGITETANWLAGASAAEFEPVDGLIGRMWGGSMAVCDEEGKLHGQGEGEILVQSPALMQGYFALPELTAEVLHGGWYRTGDVGRIEVDGTARLTGRIKHEINLAGIKVHPEDIDLLLERHPQVLETCAFGIPDAISGEVVGIAVRLGDGLPGGEATESVLRDWCEERLRREAVPTRWFFVDAIPKTDRGKVNREQVMRHCTRAGE